MTDSSGPVPVRALRGRVTMADYARGSKSERRAVFIDTDDGRFLLRRKAGPVYGDAELERYVGQTVECDGFRLGTTVLAETIRPIE